MTLLSDRKNNTEAEIIRISNALRFFIGQFGPVFLPIRSVSPVNIVENGSYVNYLDRFVRQFLNGTTVALRAARARAFIVNGGSRGTATMVCSLLEASEGGLCSVASY